MLNVFCGSLGLGHVPGGALSETFADPTPTLFFLYRFSRCGEVAEREAIWRLGARDHFQSFVSFCLSFVFPLLFSPLRQTGCTAATLIIISNAWLIHKSLCQLQAKSSRFNSV